MTKKHFMLFLMLAFIAKVGAQELLSPSFSYSHKKTAYITLTDGTEIKGTLKDVDRKKGLITDIKIKDGDGKKHKLDADDIKYMYLPPSGLDKLSKALDAMYDVQKWNDEKMDQDLLNQGYVYFENSNVKIKKKERVLLMQLLNPTFSKKVKVYHDPMAKQTMSIGVGSLTLAGGNAKSYFIKTGKGAAFKLKKKDYKKEFMPLWSKCKAVKQKFKTIKWNELTQHVITFTECE